MQEKSSLQAWLNANCPYLWSLLNQKARMNIPPGLAEYLSPLSEQQLDCLANEDPCLSRSYLFGQFHRHELAEACTDAGRKKLICADKQIKVLIDICGSKAVGDTYRRDLSNINTETQLSEILCEIAFCSSASKLSRTSPCLRPSSKRPGRKTHCDILFQLGESTVYGEVKQYIDPFPLKPGMPGRRSLVQSPSGVKPLGVARPRVMDLLSKLQNVPDQFPEGTLNLLFIFHRPPDPSWRYIQQTLFGGLSQLHTFAAAPDRVCLNHNGLFANERWKTISGCCLCCFENDSLVCLTTWENPQASVPIPSSVRAIVGLLRSSGAVVGA